MNIVPVKMNKKVYIKSKQFEFEGIMSEEKIEELMHSFLRLQKFKNLVKGSLEGDRDYNIKNYNAKRLHEETVGGVEFLIWDINLPRPRKNNVGIFSLRSDYTVPTNDTMYDCIDCKEINRPHEIKNGLPSKAFSNLYKLDYLDRRKLSTTGWYRICTGCGKHDGPWSNYGDG